MPTLTARDRRGMSSRGDIRELSPCDDFATMSANGDTVRIQSPVDLGLVIRDRRRQLGLDQKTLAGRVGVSRQWVVEIEKGKPRAEIGLILRTLRELEIQLDAVSQAARRPAKRGSSSAPDLDAIIENLRSKRR